MKELKAYRLTVENIENGYKNRLYYAAETVEEAKEYFDKNWSKFQNLIKIDDISHTSRGMDLIGRATSRFA